MAGFFIMIENFLYRPIIIENPLRFKGEIKLPYPNSVLYAGASYRRHQALQELFPDLRPIKHMRIDPEPSDDDVLFVMQHKIEKAYTLTPFHENEVIIGADTRTVTPVFNGVGIYFKSRGKPSSEKEVFSIFQEMKKASDVSHDGLSYSLDNASGLLFRNSKDCFFEMREKTLITLSHSAINRLAEREGFVEYLQAMKRHYNSPLYPYPVNISDISSGMSLATLVNMGAIEEIEGVHKDSPQFYKMVRYAFYIATIGISSELLELVGVHRGKITSQNSWLNQVTKRALQINE